MLFTCTLQVRSYMLLENSEEPSQLKGLIDQEICRHANDFVGNIYSSFSVHVCALREASGAGVRLKPCKDV